MKAILIATKRAFIFPLLKVMAYVDEHQKMKSWCLSQFSKYPVLTEKLLCLHRNYNVISKIDASMNDIDLFYRESGAHLPDIRLSNLPPKARAIYVELKSEMALRARAKG
jgi:hypothetical protein